MRKSYVDNLSHLFTAILELFDFDEITHESDGLLRRVGDTESLSSDAITIKWRYSEEEAVIRYDFIVKGAVLENRYDVLIPNDNYSKIDAIGYVPGSSFKFNLVAM
uniref:Uncharacterized protein n=1 Tax=Prorocentrum micans TaxID=2945 RepID=A0A7S2TCG9_PROMC|mmetsp:Transcript_10520/g.13185  ORF Transcript_10520/g.13185 Transcript_10520/m.13185 type:complete len:106 (-) Transcript_10520:108-425(-)